MTTKKTKKGKKPMNSTSEETTVFVMKWFIENGFTLAADRFSVICNRLIVPVQMAADIKDVGNFEKLKWLADKGFFFCKENETLAVTNGVVTMQIMDVLNKVEDAEQLDAMVQSFGMTLN
jgi:hypothetical protein